MKQEQQIYVPVKVEDELPRSQQDNNLLVDHLPFSGIYYANGNGFYNEPREHFNIAGKSILYKDKFHKIEWLKPITAIVLSKEEWEVVQKLEIKIDEIMTTVLKYRAYDNEESKVGNHCYNLAQEATTLLSQLK